MNIQLELLNLAIILLNFIINRELIIKWLFKFLLLLINNVEVAQFIEVRSLQSLISVGIFLILNFAFQLFIDISVNSLYNFSFFPQNIK